MVEHTRRSAFTLRFEDEATHEALRVVADHLGVSMNQLAQDMIKRELRVASLAVERDLSETLALVRAFRGAGLAEDVAAFADAEMNEEDPIQTRLVRVGMHDRLGISEVFA
jgi:hypothetical protein